MIKTFNRPGWRYAIRALLFTSLLTVMLWGPFSRQVLHSGNTWFRPWIMFKGMAVGVVDARFYRPRPDGRREWLDRYDILGYEDWRAAPKPVWRIRGRGSARKLGRRLCARLGASDLRVVSRLATRQGWVEEETGVRNVCLPENERP